MERIWGVVFVSFFLTSCSAKLAQYYQSTKPSEALTVAEAGGLDGLRDLREDELKKIWKVEDSNDQAAIRASMAAGTAMGVYAPPPGFSSSASTNLLAAGAVLSFLKTNPASYPRYFVWMPKSEAKSEEGAREKLEQYFLSAYQKALPKHHVSIVNEPIYGARSQKPYRYIKIVGENCQPSCSATGPLFHGKQQPSLEESPGFVGGNEAWTWQRFRFSDRSVCCHGYAIKDGDLDIQQKILFWQELSKHLPPWMYHYVPPKYAAGMPMMFNNGRQLLFVRQPK